MGGCNMQIQKLRRGHSLLFLGSDQISSLCLSALALHPTVTRLEVLSPSLSTPLADTAKTLGLKVSAPASAHAKMLEWDLLQPTAELWSQQFDYLVVASFGHFIPEKLLNHFPRNLNMHPSLLPKYRGASPIQFTILNQDSVAGVSIIELHPKSFDKGRILLQQPLQHVDLTRVTYADLSVLLAKLGGTMLTKAIEEFSSLAPVIQDEGRASKAPKLSADLGQLKCQDSAIQIYTTFRALFGTSIRPFFTFRGSLILPQKMRLATSEEITVLKERYPKAVPGSIWVLFPALGKSLKPKSSFIKQIDPVLFIQTGAGWLALTEFVRAGKPLTKSTLTEFQAAFLPQPLYQQVPVLDTGSAVSFT